MRGLILIVAAAAGGMAAMAWARAPALNESEEVLFERLERVVAGGQPTPAEIVQAFGLPAPCGRPEICAFTLPDTAQVGFAAGDLRGSESGLVFVLEHPRGQCIRIDRVRARFTQTQLGNGCHHADCWYVETRNDWGLLAFGVDTPDATCASSVVINTYGSERSRDAAR